MKQTPGYPARQGLYDPQHEHDACGIGFVVQIEGKKSHAIIRQAVTILVNLSHRGGAGSEKQTGDGAGILIQLPDKYFRQVCPNLGIFLPDAGAYGVGMVFLPRERDHRRSCEETIEQIVRDEGQEVLGWRTVPVNEESLGDTAKASRPYIRQLFIGRPESQAGAGELDFERKLYVIRKRCEKTVEGIPESSGAYFYFASLSCRTIVYKGMLTAGQVDAFYVDLTNLEVESALALVHSRYSTNTFPSWERAHPYRYLIHNGEINTLRGNVNWMNARQGTLQTDLFGEDISRVFPIINPNGSDSAMFDNCLEFLHLAGRTLPHAAMMMVPEPWNKHESMSDARKAFYEYHSTLMEPWDGPAAMAFTDGVQVGAILDRNGLRPSRFTVTKDGFVILASEAGVLDIAPDNISRRDRLRPGRMLLVDTAAGRIINDDELKENIASAYPYRQWLNENITGLSCLPSGETPDANSGVFLERLEQAFGFTYEDLRSIILPMAQNGAEPIGSMGTDTPLAVLSEKPQLLYNYFKQMFAQVTNPPIDALREEIVTSAETTVGPRGDLIRQETCPNPQIRLKSPVISNKELAALRCSEQAGLKSVTLPILYEAGLDGAGLEQAMDGLFKSVDQAIAGGAAIIILSDRGVSAEMSPIPALLAVSGVQQHLVRTGSRTRISLVLESGEPREVHHFALLIGYGASAVNPWLAFDIIGALWQQGLFDGLTCEEAINRYIKASVKGIIKILSKMGISTIQSYRGSQIFEALGIHPSVIDRYFTATISRIGGIDLQVIAEETRLRHFHAFDPNRTDRGLDAGGQYQWRSGGEYHLYNPLSVYKLQQAVREGDFQLFKEFSRLMNVESRQLCTLRGLLDLRPASAPVPLDEVEPARSIVRRFKTGAMSYGSISQEAHETLAVAMNRLGAKSNTGEGGEDPRRFAPLENGDSLRSEIKQVASGRFGVTSEYLVNASELQIKMAQGAKPGEGGQLPGRKVYPWIARTRHSTPGVGLISPPPHHDIYSIEDLAELIHDLKNANDQARISVKLVSEAGVGTVAAGVAKGRADVVLISGYDGGTGASPISSIRHAGLPWELGIAETHQTLMLNGLRGRITIEADGKLLTGRDVVVAALLGAEEFGFATGPLIALGCVMMRACDRDTCPVGIATQNPELRKRFSGKPEDVENFMLYIAEEVREIMADLGFRTLREMVGRTDCLRLSSDIKSKKAASVDLSSLLAGTGGPDSERTCQSSQDHGLADSLDHKVLLPACRSALARGLPFQATLPVRNTSRVVGTRLGSEITRRYGAYGLPADTILLKFVGSAGQSFGAFIPHGLTMIIEGEANDYIGKGLSGGKIIVRPDPRSDFKPEENIIIGNVAFYGATSGEAYIRGIAGERFCVRNSGALAVAEGAGDHGCEYMTGGRVVILGPAGRNFAAGMSGGIAYVLDTDGHFLSRCNTEMADPVLLADPEEIAEVREMIRKHVQWTGSSYAAGILAEWENWLPRFWKVCPHEYQQMQEAFAAAQKQGLHGDEALMAAFAYSQKPADRPFATNVASAAPAGGHLASGEEHGKNDRIHRIQARTAV